MKEDQACLTNIGARDARTRRVAGAAALAGGVAAGAFLILAHWHPAWRGALLAPFLLGLLGLLQAREKT